MLELLANLLSGAAFGLTAGRCALFFLDEPTCPKSLIKYPKVIEEVATKRLVHKLPQYINELASALHSFYNDEKVITDNTQEVVEKLTVMKAVQIVLKDALSLIGVSAPEKMEQK